MKKQFKRKLSVLLAAVMAFGSIAFSATNWSVNFCNSLPLSSALFTTLTAHNSPTQAKGRGSLRLTPSRPSSGAIFYVQYLMSG